MSLETNLELNNQLVTRNNELLERLISTLASGVAMRPDTVAKVQEYREQVPETEPQPETAPETKAALTLDSLEFSDVIALAGFYPEQVELSDTMLQRAIDYRDAEGDKRVVQIDALDSALLGVKRAKALHKDVLLQLSRTILANWDGLPTIANRRAFAETWLDAKPEERGAVKPGKVTEEGKQQRKGPFYWKHPESGSFGTVEDTGALNEILEDGLTVEINKVEYLQLKEDAEKNSPADVAGEPDITALREQATELVTRLVKSGYRAEVVDALASFGAKKLGEVGDKDLSTLVKRLEKSLEAEDD
ncbi:hypothetical protein ATQ15_16420 [Salmonella enterica]|uniref:Uncharacterized protein n=1 Tax=Salmonella enterica TaxID=28901 RepID=A0A402SRL9_SALER|nr:hypothetical protein [Salmonella enterica]EAX3248072.1 hypothetical protein [Salmonella enterica]EBP9529039.1 hypothetical protein [Salmonella enterica]EBP9588800.1 hypothetical protein [Salmonella enterica]EBP9594301.1 hypothetical protein [Salmonella enterica]